MEGKFSRGNARMAESVKKKGKGGRKVGEDGLGSSGEVIQRDT